MADLTRAGIAAWVSRLRRAWDAATKAAQEAGQKYLTQQASKAQGQSQTLTPFRPGPKGREEVFGKTEPLFEMKPLFKPVKLFELTPLVEVNPLIDRPVPVVKGDWHPSPGQLRDLAQVIAKSFNETMRRETQ